MDRRKYIKILVVMAIAIIILICDIVFSIKQEIDYEQRKDSGNNRWLQVENRILQTEEKVNAIEEKLQLQ